MLRREQQQPAEAICVTSMQNYSVDGKTVPVNSKLINFILIKVMMKDNVAWFLNDGKMLVFLNLLY